MSSRSADSPASPDRTADGPAGRIDMSGRSAGNPSSRLIVEIVSQPGRFIDFVGRLTGAIRPAITSALLVVAVAKMIYDNISDYVITSSRQLLQIVYSIFINNGDNVVDL